MARTLRRLDLTARSLFAVVDRGSCFAGSLLEIALAADRIYMLRDSAGAVRMASSPLNGGLLPMTHGPSRLQVRFLADPARVDRDRSPNANPSTPMPPNKPAWSPPPWTKSTGKTSCAWPSRNAPASRPMPSPAWRPTCASPAPRTPTAKVFGRLSAWQNWIFSRPNATGERGALTLYGKPERPQFNWRRT